MPDDLPTYDLFAIRYANRAAKRSDHFIGGDPHDGPMPMDYFVWVAVSGAGAYVIDTGFTAEVAARRGRTFLRCPVEALRLVGVDPDAVAHVILTHMHYDHVGNFHKFPRARFHLQEPELRYATGRLMTHARLRFRSASPGIPRPAIRSGCSLCGCTRGAAGSWSRPT